MDHLINVFFVCSDSFGLFCYRTIWIYQFSQHIFHCLSVHSDLVCLNIVLNMINVQIDNYFEINGGHLVWSKLTSDYLIFLMVAMNQFFLSLGTSFFTGNQVFSSFPWQPHFFVTKVLVAPGNKQFLLSNHRLIHSSTICSLSYRLISYLPVFGTDLYLLYLFDSFI